MRKRLAYLAMILLVGLLAACSPSATPIGEPQATKASTAVPAPGGTATSPPLGEPTPLPIEVVEIEGRMVELEWPAVIRLGESDVVRVSMVPVQEGYVATAEFSDHSLQTRAVSIPRPPGYDLVALARLDGVGFSIEPPGEQARFLPPGEAVSWRWTLSPRSAGRHGLTVQLLLRWEPVAADQSVRESQAFSRGLEIQVRSFLGLSPAQAASGGLAGLVIGSGLCLAALVGLKPRSSLARTPELRSTNPAPQLSIECPPAIRLTAEENGLLRALFAVYARLVIDREFLSGYSGARTFLVRPICTDGLADAATIVKLGPREAIRQEWTNYEHFVQHRLPPVTARIQRAPVTIPRARQAAMQYTFIADPGHQPMSLRQVLAQDPDAAWLTRLFETFGPYWWMQRRPATFRLGQEYDRLLPPHFVLQPQAGGHTSIVISENMDAAQLHLNPGDRVRVQPFQQVEMRSDGQSLTLTGRPAAGRPALRLRWLAVEAPKFTEARVIATRDSLLHAITAPFDRFDMPDPLARLPALLDELVSGTFSVIHGDLNLENVLVGPGGLVWLIDFAQTREGHPLYDFAHLESEIIAHLLAERSGSPASYLALWRSRADPLLNAVHNAAMRCLFDPLSTREYDLALMMACLGALKYANLSSLQKHCLFLTAADLQK